MVFGVWRKCYFNVGFGSVLGGCWVVVLWLLVGCCLWCCCDVVFVVCVLFGLGFFCCL